MHFLLESWALLFDSPFLSLFMFIRFRSDKMYVFGWMCGVVIWAGIFLSRSCHSRSHTYHRKYHVEHIIQSFYISNKYSLTVKQKRGKRWRWWSRNRSEIYRKKVENVESMRKVDEANWIRKLSVVRSQFSKFSLGPVADCFWLK